MKINIKKLPQSEVEIEGELASEVFESYFQKALETIGAGVEVAGFRKGKVPQNVLLSKIPEMQILEEMAEMALAEHYPKILVDEAIDAISRPEIFITKLARNNALEFKIKTAVMPKMKLPDYKKTAKDVLSKIDKDKKIEVTEEEVEATIMDIRKSRAHHEHMAMHEAGGEHDHEEVEKLPEFTDEFVQALGPFKDIADFREKLKENIKLEKEFAEKEKTRLKIIEEIISGTEVELPRILVDSEINKILYRMQSDISNMGMKFEDYLKQINKTTDDLKTEFTKDAEKKAKLALVLAEIANIEKITPDKDRVEKEVEMIMAQYKDADHERAVAHTENVLTNEKIFQFLETQ